MAQNRFAARVPFLAVILIAAGTTACAGTTPGATEVAVVTVVIDTPVPKTANPIPATPTPTVKKPSPTPSHTPVPPTNTATTRPTRTPIPVTNTPTVESVTPTNPPATQNIKSPASAGVKTYENTITLPTYPFKDYLTEQIDPLYNMPVFYFNRADFEAAAPTPAPIDYTGVVLENPYLRLTFLPELGGRLYSAVIKSTGQELFYHNPVVKPSRYGVLQPYEANWWLATGGMEWAYPTQEHGYRFGVPWDFSVSTSSSGATITLNDTGSDRVSLSVAVTLPANSPVFSVTPKLTNNRPNPVPVQLWTNAALALTPGSMSPDTEFIVPTEVITIHSRGEAGWTVPGEKEQAPWPQVDATDLRQYNQWANYLGFFVPNQVAPFAAAYNSATDLGIVRLASAASPGSHKLFAFGTAFPDRSYTDDDSQYFEIWGGANAGFWPEDDIMVSPGQMLGWQESWWPLARLNGLTWANQQVAIHLNKIDNTYTLSALMAQPTLGQVQVLAAGSPILTESFTGSPAVPLQWQFPTTNNPITIQFTDNTGTVLLEYQVNA